jgi:hypothetical protein
MIFHLIFSIVIDIFDFECCFAMLFEILPPFWGSSSDILGLLIFRSLNGVDGMQQDSFMSRGLS